MKRIVLIDDDSSTNFLNRLVIEKSELVDEILTFESGKEALDYFKGRIETEDGSLILLDINMPIMNGWEFMEEYVALNGKLKSNKVVVLTSSIDPVDKQKAEENIQVVEMKSKPLSPTILKELVSKYLN